jgi:hypothetical protein
MVMKLSELYAGIQAAGDVRSYAVWLAAPDKDGVDVDLAAVGRVDTESEPGKARLYPASTTTDTDSIEPEPILDIVLSRLPSEINEDNDLRLVVETPLLRDESGTDLVTFADIKELYVGQESGEVWFLVRPASEFAEGLLPD